MREATAFGSKVWGATLLQLINYRLDLFLLGAFVSRAEVGRYSVALSVTALAWVLPAALETVIFPRTADLHAAEVRGEISAEDADEATVRAVRHSVVLLVPATVLVLVLVVGAVPLLYGSAFMQTVWYGLILIPGVIALSLGKSVSAVIAGRGRPQYALWTTAITVPLTIVLYLALIPILGGLRCSARLDYLVPCEHGAWTDLVQADYPAPVAGGAGALARRAPRLCGCAERCPPSPAPEGRLGVATVAVEPLYWMSGLRRDATETPVCQRWVADRTLCRVHSRLCRRQPGSGGDRPDL